MKYFYYMAAVIAIGYGIMVWCGAITSSKFDIGLTNILLGMFILEASGDSK